MMQFQFTIGHVPGKELTIADTLSHALPSTPTATDKLLQLEANAFVNMVLLQQLPAGSDSTKTMTKHAILPIWLAWQAVSQHHCTTILPYGSRIFSRRCKEVILWSLPHSARNYWTRFMRDIRVSQSITKCRERARQSLWWPGLSRDLDHEELVWTCTMCCKAQKQRAQPIIPSPLPKLPWQVVGTDLFEWNQETFLLIVDYYSRFIETTQLNRLTVDEGIGMEYLKLAPSMHLRHTDCLHGTTNSNT